jgi:gliding motility-associated-like protein
MYLFVNDTVVADAGPDQELCFNDTITLLAGGLDTAGNTKNGRYIWYDLTTNAPIRTNKGGADSISFSAVADVEYELELYVTEDTVTCFDNDSVAIVVNPLPVIDLVPDYEVCCMDGDISMRFNLKSTDPVGGVWSVANQPTWVTGETFHADSACASTSTAVTLTYTYTEPVTGCINSNDIVITVNPLPVIELKSGDFCQDINEFHMADELVRRPANEFNGTQTWKCLECNGNDFANMLVDKGVGISDYWLDISEGTYTIQNEQIDTILLEYTFRNPFGCLNRDTVEIRIWKVPKLSFLDGGELCFDDGVTNLNEHFDVNWSEGWWTAEPIAGHRTPSDLGGITTDSIINTLNSVELAGPSVTPNAFYMRYHHDATGCYAFLDTTLVINPLPNISITPILSEYCDAETNVPLNATPGGSGGSWSTTMPSALTGGSTFDPSNLAEAEKNTPIWFYYEYTNPNTGCYSIDSISSSVEPTPVLALPNDTSFCRTAGQANVNLNFNITTQNAGALQWSMIRAQPGFIPGVGDGTTNAINVTTAPSNDTINLYVVDARTIKSPTDVCDAQRKSMNIYVHPIPDVNIAPNNPFECNPLTTDFVVNVNNALDPATATYDWTLGNGNTSTLANPTATYTQDGTQNISLLFTSAFGCDTTVNTTVDVYPIPDAFFVPDPADSFTTAALPRFKLTDRSTVNPVLGATVNKWYWEFGSGASVPLNSTDQNPTVEYPADTAKYRIKLVAETNHGCKDSFYLRVTIGPDLLVFVPNAFTPNGFGPNDNDAFHAVIEGEKHMELIVFNRWGEIMFQTNDKNVQWDGTFNGAPCQQGVYAYLLKVTALDDEAYQFSGTIILLR